MLIKSLTHGPGLPPPWACNLKTSNGMLAEVNSHDWDTSRWLVRSNPRRVYAEVANFKGESRGVTTPNFYDVALVQLRFENGAIGSISGVCPCEYGYDARVEVIGERGILQIGGLQGQSVVTCTDRDHGLVSPVYRTWQERFASAYAREMAHFLECARGAAKPRATGEDGRWAVAGVLAATKSFLEQRPVEISEVFSLTSEVAR
jgi:myo-inositol 2-dehydrogenase/D-chiro-inositol 1-dehydrogenase/scyllo-inositol 2-dehydrogenase (NAD+)